MTLFYLKIFKFNIPELEISTIFNKATINLSYSTPLEQFAIGGFSRPIYHNLPYLLFNISPDTLYTTLGKFLYIPSIIAIFLISMRCAILTPTLSSFINFSIYNLILGVTKNTINVKKPSFVLMFHFLLLYILASNLVGMIPGGQTSTSHLVVTLFLSLGLFTGHNIISVIWNEEKFFRLFLPLTSPVIITFLIVPIEYISYFSRVLSLAIRLFANMMSGHVLLKILISFVFTGISTHVIHWFWIWIPAFVVFLVIGLEFIIAFIQAFVFVLLSIIYLNEAICID